MVDLPGTWLLSILDGQRRYAHIAGLPGDEVVPEIWHEQDVSDKSLRRALSALAPANIDGAKHAWAVLSWLVKRFRQSWPEVCIIYRGDRGFCRHRMLAWYERHDVGYLVGIAQNKRLNEISAQWQQAAEKQYALSNEKVRWFDEFHYAARSWQRTRRIIVKIEHTDKGSHPRHVVTNLIGKPQFLYDKLYCSRGEMENCIKEQPLYLFADRTSCHRWWSNHFRLLLSSLAYILLETIPRLDLKAPNWLRPM